MMKPNMVMVFVLALSLVALCLGCDSETTAPKRNDPPPVDPVDWDGDKGDGSGFGPGGALSDNPSSVSGTYGFGARNHALGCDLEPHDHTIIMEAILANVSEISARLPQNQVSSGREILQATLAVPAVGRYTKSRIRMVLDWLDRLEQAEDSIPPENLQAMSEAMQRLETYPSLADKIEALQSMIDSGQYDMYEGLTEGMAAGIAILRDGEKTIYRPRVLINLKRLAQQDLEGAAAGALSGLIVAGPPGAGVGAIAGAAGASGSDLIGQLTGWW